MTTGRSVVWAVAVVVATLAIAIVAGEVSGWPFLKRPLHDALQRAAGVPVQMDGRMRLHLLWRPRLELDHLNIASAPAVAAPHLLQGRQLTITWRWADLWRWHQGGVLRLRSLRADVLDVQLVRQRDGDASWQIGRARTVPPPPGGQPLPTAGRLELGSGRIVIDDAVHDTRLSIEVRGGEGAPQARMASGYQATISGRYRALPLGLTLRSDAALPLLRDNDDDSDSLGAMTALRVEGTAGASRIVFDGQAAALLSARHLDGALRFSGPSLASVGDPLGLTLPRTPAFSLLGRLRHHDGLWTLHAERLTVGRSDLAGEFRYDTRLQPPRLSGRATGTHLALADLGPSIGAPTGGSAPRPKPAASALERRVLPQHHFDLPSLRAMDADVEVAIEQLVLSTSAVTPLRDLRTRVVLADGVLELQRLQARVAGGLLNGSTRLDGRGEPARWAATLRFGEVDVAGWVRGLRTPEGQRQAPSSNDATALRRQRSATRQAAESGAGETVPAYLTGELEASVDVKGAGGSTAEILSTLEGPVNLLVHDGTMSHLVTEAMGVDLAQALGVAIKGDDVLPLRCARFDFATQNGVMRLTRGVLDNPDSTIRVAGQVDLRNEQLALAARARPKDASPVSLRSPVFVRGTLSSPQVSIEPSRLAARALGAVALGALVNPLAALIPLIDTGEKEAGDPCIITSNSAEPPAKPAVAASTPTHRQGAAR